VLEFYYECRSNRNQLRTNCDLQRTHALSEAQIIEQALLLMAQDDADWTAILADTQSIMTLAKIKLLH
jgi:hypothetical protein